MKNFIKKITFNRKCGKGACETVLAFSITTIMLISQLHGSTVHSASNIHSSKDETYWTTTPVLYSDKAITNSKSIRNTVISAPTISQTLNLAEESQILQNSFIYMAQITSELKIDSRTVWEESTETVHNNQFPIINMSLSTSSYSLAPTPSSSRLSLDSSKELYLNVASIGTNVEKVLNSSSVIEASLINTSHSSDIVPDVITILPTSATDIEKLLYLTTVIYPPKTYTNIQLTPVLDHQINFKDAQIVESILVAPTPPSWQMSEASAATVAQGAMTWITSQPSSAEHLQSEFHLPAGTVAGIVVASIGFVGIVAAALGFVALKRFRNLHAKTYDSTYAGDTFSYLDNLQVSYINHHVELPKDSSDEMFSLDNDSFLNSLEAMTMENYWAEESKSTKV